MNHPPTPKPARRTPRGKAGFTPQQVIVLIVTAVLGFAALGLAAYALLLPPTSIAFPPATQAAAATLPVANTPAAETPAPRALVLPAACLQKNSGMQQGTAARVIDGSTIEVLVDGIPLRVRYAGIRIPDSGPLAEQAAEAARSVIEGQDIFLLQDPGAAVESSGASLTRYILTGSRFLNLELVQQGLGQANLDSPEQICANLFLQAEQQARAEKIGLWQPQRVPTATFMPFVTLDPSRDAPCDCISRPECSQFRTHNEAQACFNACNDYNSRLDEDRDGIACEELP